MVHYRIYLQNIIIDMMNFTELAMTCDQSHNSSMILVFIQSTLISIVLGHNKNIFKCIQYVQNVHTELLKSFCVICA